MSAAARRIGTWWVAILVGFVAVVPAAFAVQPITSIQAHYDSLDDPSEDFAINGAGSGAFPTGTVFQSQFTVGQFDNLVIDAFDVSTNNFIFRQLAQRISIVRVNNSSVTGAHHILLYDQEGAIQDTTNIFLSSQFVQDMEDILLSEVINRGVDNVFCNTGNGDGNNNNIERIDYIFNDGYPAFGNLRKKGFMVMDRGGNDALWIAAILSLDTNGSPASFSSPVLLTTTNWGNSGITLDTIVYRGYGDDRRPSADVGPQPLTGQYIEWEEFGISTNTLVYGYSLAAADVPATQNWLNVSSFPTNTTEGSQAGGLDLMSGGALVLDERLNATLGDRVWNDLDQDGLQDAGEPGLSNVLVRVWDSSGTNLAGQARTDSNGFFFVYALEANFYQLEVVPPTNYVISPQDIGPDDSLDSDVDTNTARTGLIQLFPSVTNDTVDSGMYLPPTDLGVSKRVSSATPRVGTNITFTIAFTNFGPFSAGDVQVTDLLPAGLTFSNASPSVGTYDRTTGVWSIGAVNTGAVASLVITARVDLASGGLALTNTATITFSDRPDTNQANNASSAVVQVLSLDLGASKTVSNPLPGVTNLITYTVYVTNFGPVVATSLVVTDAIPAGLTFSNATASLGSYSTNGNLWNIGTLSNGQFATLTITARVSAGSAGLVITNTATILTSGQGDTNPANDSASAVLTVLGADLAVFKTADNTAPYPGSNVVFTILVTNNGPTLATGVTLTDILTNNIAYVSSVASSGSYNQASGIWTVGTLQAGGFATLDMTATVPTNAINVMMTNRAYISNSGVADGNSANNTGTVLLAVSALRIDKTSDVVGSVLPGSNITYTIVVSNASSVVQTNVVITDPLPTGTTYVAASAQITGPITATNDVLDRFETAAFTNQNGTTNWSGNWTEIGEADGAALSDVAVVSDGTNRVLRLEDNDNGGEGVSRQVNLAGRSSATLGFYYRRVGLDGSTDYVAIYASSNGGASFVEIDRLAGPNNDASYVFTNYDISAYIASNTQIRFLTSPTMGGTDLIYFNDIRVSWTQGGTNTIAGGTPPYLGTNWVLRPAEYLTVTFRVTVDNPVAVTQIVNTASAYSQSQLLPVSDTETDPISATDLGVVKSVNNPNPNAGSNVVFTITVTNNGPLNASSVQVTDLLTNGLSYVTSTVTRGSFATNTGVWTVGVLTNGRSDTLTLTARVSTNTIYVGAVLTNIARITGSSLADTIPDNNVATALVTVGSADLAVTKTVDDASPLLGSNVTYTIVVTNIGPSPASSVLLTDLVPAGLRLTGYSPSQGTYATNTGVWTVGSLSLGAYATLTLNASLTTTVIGAYITNRAVITGSAQPDPSLLNNTGSVVILTTSADPLIITKTSSAAGSALPGYTNIYTIIVTNPNSFAHTGIFVSDPIPSGVTYVASSTQISGPEYESNVWFDAFSSRQYGNNHGTTNWLSSWDESESGDDPLAGNIQITYDSLRGVTYSLQFQGGSVTQGIRRNADLGTYTNGLVSFEYRRESLEAGDFVLAQISSNGFAGPWSTLLRMEGPATDTDYTSTNFDIRPWLSTNVGIRFVTTNTAMGAGDIVWIDDVQISAQHDQYTTRLGGLPPTVGSNLYLRAHDYAVITFRARVDNPASVTQIVNTASVTSDQQVVTLYASVTDRVEFADLGVGKAVNDTLPDEGTVVSFTLLLTNYGPFAASGIVLSDVLPAGLTYQSYSTSTGTYSAALNEWTVGNLAVSNSVALTLNVTVSGGTAGETLTNLVRVLSANQGDRNLTNNEATATVRVVPPFIITDCDYNVTNQAVEISHQIINGQQVYDLLYVDAITFHQGLSNQWTLADRRAGGMLVDTGAVGRTAPIDLGAGWLRFYRISAPGFWEESPRRASAQVDAFGVSYLYPGQNWVRPWGIPCNNTIGDLFEHLMPAGSNVSTATRVMWFNRTPWPVPATQEVWLAASQDQQQWTCSWPSERGGQSAEAWPLPYDQGFLVEIPTNLPAQRLPMVFGVPTNTQTQVLPGGNRYSMVSINLPESQHPSQLRLLEAGFKGGANPILSDWLWKYDRPSQVAPRVIYFNTVSNAWLFTSDNVRVPTNWFRPDDAVVVQTRKSASNLTWTNYFHYPTPTRDVNP